MEVLPCPKQYVGEADCPQQSPETDFIYKEKTNCDEHDKQTQPGDHIVDEIGEADCPQQSPETDFIYKEKTNCDEHDKQTQPGDHIVDEIIVEAQGSLKEEQAKDCERVEEFISSIGPTNGTCNMDGLLEGPSVSVDYHGSQNGDLTNQNHIECDRLSATSGETSNSFDNGLPSTNYDEDPSLEDSEWLDQDEPLAVWVKCQGKWKAGIRCTNADCPSSVSRTKPIHGTKRHFLIFFPDTKIYLWADVALIRPINELPQPIAHMTHDAGREGVKDLEIAHLFTMQKLAVGMLNIIDELHPKGLRETAHDMMFWKEFAMEASQCRKYSDLGAMLVKLHRMMLQSVLSSDWLKNSAHSWIQQSEAADNAATIELLTEELSNSILWKEVNSPSSETKQSHITFDWKSWKDEILKCFLLYKPAINSEDPEERSYDETCNLNGSSRKRPKLEVRRAELNSSHSEMKGALGAVFDDAGLVYLGGRDDASPVTLASESCKEESSMVGDKSQELHCAAEKAGCISAQGVASTPVNEVTGGNPLNPESKTRQCAVYIEAKGRQCVRSANEGSVYCCIHVAPRVLSNSGKPKPARSVDNPMCGGTTTHGSRCKHRSLTGSPFCKKHGPHNDPDSTMLTSDNKLKRKLDDSSFNMATTSRFDMALAGEVGRALQGQSLPLKHGDASNERPITSVVEHSGSTNERPEQLHCVGPCLKDENNPCRETAKRHSLYCDMHLPNWLKRARNGKSRVISKDVYIELLRSCSSVEQKKQLHRACELFYRFFKGVQSARNPVPKEAQLQWALSEASKDSNVREILMTLISSEKERLQRHWGLSADQNAHPSSSLVRRPPVRRPPVVPSTVRGYQDMQEIIKCKICSAEFLDDTTLGAHWIESHKKESQWLFRGYACAICHDSFTNKKILEAHIQEKHQVPLVDQYMLLQCILCDSHFGNSKDLWLHVLLCHPAHLKLSEVAQPDNSPPKKDPAKQPELGTAASVDNKNEYQTNSPKFACRFCGLKFDLLPDLGRHHQAAHMGQSFASARSPKVGLHYYARKLKAGRLKHPRFKKGLSSYQIRNRASAKMKRLIQASKPTSIVQTDIQDDVQQLVYLGRLGEPECTEVANLLFSEVQRAKPRPSNQDILSVARSTCCKFNLQSFLEARYGVMPKSLYLKAAKLCSEHNIKIKWHQERFVCPNGCKSGGEPDLISDILLRSKDLMAVTSNAKKLVSESKEWEMDECHYVLGPSQFSQRPVKTVLCCDISFGQESVPVASVVDGDLMDLYYILPNGSYSDKSGDPMPWESFTYVTKVLVDQSVDLDAKTTQLRRDDLLLTCSSRTCDQVYLFNTDYDDARDVFGKSMQGRFAYDEQRCIVLEEGYLIYECNHMCGCGKACQNRVLQNGVQVKLEVVKKKEKGWAVRAGQPIRSGAFICEYVGEILDEQEANRRLKSYVSDGCSYMYKIDPQSNDISRLNGGQDSFIIDSTKYGNVSRFVCHSFSPNLTNHQVLVEKMDCQLAHIGFYARQDIPAGEELTFNFQHGKLVGEGCNCGASACRGRRI